MKRLTVLFYFIFFANICILISQENSDALRFEKKAEMLEKESKLDSAVYYFLRAAESYNERKEWVDYVRNIRQATYVYIKLSKFKEAESIAEKAINIMDVYFTSNSEQEKNEEYELFNETGAVYNRMGQYQKEIEYYEKALNLLTGTDSTTTLKKAKLWGNLCSAYIFTGDYNKAIQYGEESLNTKKKYLGNDHIDLVTSLLNLGIVYSTISQYEKALAYFQEALRINIKEYGVEHINVAGNYLHLGILYRKIGDSENALKFQKKSLKIKEKVYGKIHDEVARDYMNIGVVYYKKGEFDKAIEFNEQALNISIQVYGKIHPETAKCYNNMGIYYRHKKQFSKALTYYKKAAEIKEKIYGASHFSLASTYNNIGNILTSLQKYDEALSYFNKAMSIGIEHYGKNHHGIALVYYGIGMLYEKKGDFKNAIDNYFTALEIYKNIFGNKHPFIATIYDEIGFNYYHQKKYNEALNYHQKAILSNHITFNDTTVENNPASFDVLNSRELLYSFYDKARAFNAISLNSDESNKYLDLSIKSYDDTYKLINKIRNDLDIESTQILFSQETREIFSDAINTSIRQANSNKQLQNKPFDYLEKSKSTLLWAFLNERQIKISSNINDSLLKKEKKILDNRKKLETELQKAKAKQENYDTLFVQDLQDELFNLTRSYDSLMVLYNSKYPDYYELKYQQKVASIDELQQQLDNNTTLLNYFVADTSLFIAAVTRDSLVYKVVKTDSLFNQQLIDYRIDIEFDFTKGELQASKKLYNYLIAPVEGLIEGKNKLVILPDEKLYYVPFETLCKKGEDLAQPDYLIKSYAINYHHSATLWLNSKTKERKSVASNSFIGFAPVFDPQVNNGTILSNEWIADTTQTDVATRSVSTDFNHFNALPNSEKEIKSILKLFNKKDGKAEGYLHKEATEENFKNNVGNYKYVHIASHSFTNDKYPALSGIAFSQPDTTNRKENDEDGILYAGESYNLNLSNADLVVLSSCKSGLGKLIKGEGFLSLSRGFIYSGAPNIVYSLWSVKDEPTKDLMVHFYKQLLSGKTYADALREAKLKILSNPKTAQPQYWAAWVLLGK